MVQDKVVFDNTDGAGYGTSKNRRLFLGKDLHFWDFLSQEKYAETESHILLNVY